MTEPVFLCGTLVQAVYDSPWIGVVSRLEEMSRKEIHDMQPNSPRLSLLVKFWDGDDFTYDALLASRCQLLTLQELLESPPSVSSNWARGEYARSNVTVFESPLGWSVLLHTPTWNRLRAPDASPIPSPIGLLRPPTFTCGISYPVSNLAFMALQRATQHPREMPAGEGPNMGQSGADMKSGESAGKSSTTSVSLGNASVVTNANASANASATGGTVRRGPESKEIVSPSGSKESKLADNLGGETVQQTGGRHEDHHEDHRNAPQEQCGEKPQEGSTDRCRDINGRPAGEPFEFEEPLVREQLGTLSAGLYHVLGFRPLEDVCPGRTPNTPNYVDGEYYGYTFQGDYCAFCDKNGRIVCPGDYISLDRESVRSSPPDGRAKPRSSSSRKSRPPDPEFPCTSIDPRKAPPYLSVVLRIIQLSNGRSYRTRGNKIVIVLELKRDPVALFRKMYPAANILRLRDQRTIQQILISAGATVAVYPLPLVVRLEAQQTGCPATKRSPESPYSYIGNLPSPELVRPFCFQTYPCIPISLVKSPSESLSPLLLDSDQALGANYQTPECISLAPTHESLTYATVLETALATRCYVQGHFAQIGPADTLADTPGPTSGIPAGQPSSAQPQPTDIKNFKAPKCGMAVCTFDAIPLTSSVALALKSFIDPLVAQGALAFPACRPIPVDQATGISDDPWAMSPSRPPPPRFVDIAQYREFMQRVSAITSTIHDIVVARKLPCCYCGRRICQNDEIYGPYVYCLQKSPQPLFKAVYIPPIIVVTHKNCCDHTPETVRYETAYGVMLDANGSLELSPEIWDWGRTADPAATAATATTATTATAAATAATAVVPELGATMEAPREPKQEGSTGVQIGNSNAAACPALPTPPAPALQATPIPSCFSLEPVEEDGVSAPDPPIIRAIKADKIIRFYLQNFTKTAPLNMRLTFRPSRMNLLCSICGRPGALIGCYEEQCSFTAHYPCIVRSGLTFLGQKELHCAEHRSSKKR